MTCTPFVDDFNEDNFLVGMQLVIAVENIIGMITNFLKALIIIFSAFWEVTTFIALESA